jgi:hypothetical protein
MHYLAKKMRNGQARMEHNMCQFEFSRKEIEYSSEDKVYFFIFEFLPSNIFFCLTNLLVKLSFSKKFCSLRILCYNKQNIMRMTTRVPFPLTWHISQILLLPLALLYFFVLKNSLRVIGCLVMY